MPKILAWTRRQKAVTPVSIGSKTCSGFRLALGRQACPSDARGSVGWSALRGALRIMAEAGGVGRGVPLKIGVIGVGVMGSNHAQRPVGDGRH